MRSVQIIATVARAIAGVREITGVDVFARVSGLQLCTACVSPGTEMYLGYQPGTMHPSPHWPSANPFHHLVGLTSLAGTTANKRKRLLLANLLVTPAKGDSASLRTRDS